VDKKEPLEKFEDNWETSMGGWFPGEKVILRGKNVLTELNNDRWLEYLFYGITGRHSPRIARLIEGMWLSCTSFPDPRLWNNRIAALCATTRSTGVLASAGALAISEATIYGLKPIQGVSDFLYRTSEKVADGQALEDVVMAEVKKYRGIFGYGRPVVDQDERVGPLLEFAKSMGSGDGEYTKLAFEVDAFLAQSRLKYRINASGVVAGLLADEGITPRELYHIATLTFTAGVIPCYIDALEKPEGAFFPLRVSRVNYEGIEEQRVWRG
jgi:hypothetical protein